VLADENLMRCLKYLWESSVIEFVYKSFIRSVMSHGSECWAMKKVDTRGMHAADMRMMMYGKTLRDGIPNGSEAF